MDTKAKIPQKMNKIAHIFVRDIRGIDFINLEITSSIYMTASYEELRKSGKKLEKVGTIGKKSFI